MIYPSQYIHQNPNFVVENVEQYTTSHGEVLTIVIIDGKKVWWDSINTPTFRKHFKNDSTEVFYKWLKNYLLKNIAKYGDDVLNRDVKFCDNP